MKAINWNNIKENKPAIFDWLVFVFSLSLSFIFPSLKDFVSSKAFSNWMLAGLLLYIVGSWLKHQPLYQRIDRKVEDIPYLLFLIVGHWCIIIAAMLFSWAAVRRILGLPPIVTEDMSLGQIVCAVTAGSTFITWLVFRSGNKNKSRKVFSEKYLFFRELIADVLLICGVAMISFVFWEQGVLGLVSRMPLDGFGSALFILFFLSIAYMMCYLPLRFLYLVEDRFRKQAGRRLLLIFILVLIRSLFTALNN